MTVHESSCASSQEEKHFKHHSVCHLWPRKGLDPGLEMHCCRLALSLWDLLLRYLLSSPSDRGHWLSSLFVVSYNCFVPCIFLWLKSCSYPRLTPCRNFGRSCVPVCGEPIVSPINTLPTFVGDCAPSCQLLFKLLLVQSVPQNPELLLQSTCSWTVVPRPWYPVLSEVHTLLVNTGME